MVQVQDPIFSRCSVVLVFGYGACKLNMILGLRIYVCIKGSNSKLISMIFVWSVIVLVQCMSGETDILDLQVSLLDYLCLYSQPKRSMEVVILMGKQCLWVSETRTR